METRENILNELKQIAPKLSSLEKKNFYSVPENYFVNFKSGILEKVSLSEARVELKEVAPELSKLGAATSGVECPANYFQKFSSSLIQRIRAEEVVSELANVAPSLSELEKTFAFNVPANYFSSFPLKMQKRINADEKAIAKSSSTKWLESLNAALDNLAAVIFKPKYAVAFAGSFSIILVAALFFFNTPQETKCDKALCMLEKVSNEELNAYFDENADEFNSDVLDFSSDEVKLQQYHESRKKKNSEILLKELSDEELDDVLLN